MMKNRFSPAPQKNWWAEAGSLLLVSLALFTLFSLLTYVGSDPSFFSNTSAKAANACGRMGAFWASALLEVFGIAGFLIPAALAFLAVTLHKRESSLRTLGTFLGMAISVVALTVFLTLHWKTWHYRGAELLTGGAFGILLADPLLVQFNHLGSSVISLTVFCIALALSTPLSLMAFGLKVITAFARFIGKYGLKLAKLCAAAVVYGGSLLSLKIARATGDFFQKVLEKGLRPKFQTPEAVAVADAFVSPIPETVEQYGSGAVFAGEEIEEAEIVSPTKKSFEIITAAVEKEPSKRAAQAARTRVGPWKLPALDFLRRPPTQTSSVDRDKLLQNSKILEQKFLDFGIEGEVTAARPGPVITLYEFKPGPGVKVSRIAALADDLSMALSAQSVRILAPLPGKSVVGIEIPSETRETVFLREFLQHPDFHGTRHTIPVVMGKDISGQPYLSDLTRMPHLLCAGQTGAGKSVFMNGLICSLLYRFSPDELRMILVDPKFIEFRSYQDIPHLLLPVVDDPKHASTALKWAVREMERRYRVLAMMGARNLASFNQKVEEMGVDVVRDLLMSEENQPENMAQMTGADWIDAFEPDDNGIPRIGKLPFVVVIIDELADLMMVAKKEVEISIARIAQKARAAGIHLVIATQRPSTDVITGLIKANLPSRVSFQLASYIDSKTILDRAGAESLLGQGDMLFIPPGMSQLLRLHGAFVDDDEINKITSFLRSQGKPTYRNEILVEDEDSDEFGEEGETDDQLFQDAVELVRRNGHASASFLQRHLKVGYNRAARMIETMETRGIVGPADGARPREVLMR
jgi:S-DNA-T family DNA segregation ATPase FtsK/SpoIIIE